MNIHRIFLFLMVLSLLIACTSPISRATPTQQPTSTPVAILAVTSAPSATPELTATAEPTAVAPTPEPPLTPTEQAKPTEPVIEAPICTPGKLGEVVMYEVGLGKTLKPLGYKIFKGIYSHMLQGENQELFRLYLGLPKGQKPTYNALLKHWGVQEVVVGDTFELQPIPGKTPNMSVPGHMTAENGDEVYFKIPVNLRPSHTVMVKDDAFAGVDEIDASCLSIFSAWFRTLKS